MNIIFISRHFLPHVGGVEKHINEVTRNLKGKNKKVSIICEQAEGTRKHEKLDGIEIYRIKYPHIKIVGLLSIWFWFWKYRNLIAKSDLIHCHDVFIWYLPFRFIFPNKPVYSTFHGWEGKFPIPLKNKLIRKLSAVLSYGNICIGEYIEKWYGIKATYITYGGVKKIKQDSKPGTKLLYLGRLDHDTGIKIYLKAFREIKQKHPKLKFEFLGDGEYRNECEELGKVHGFKKDIKPYLKDAKFVFASGYLSILESLSFGRLVFTVSGNEIKRDIIKLSPFEKFVIHSASSKSLTQNIVYFLTNPKKVNTIIKQSSLWSASQTWDKVAQVYLKLWRI